MWLAKVLIKKIIKISSLDQVPQHTFCEGERKLYFYLQNYGLHLLGVLRLYNIPYG